MICRFITVSLCFAQGLLLAQTPTLPPNPVLSKTWPTEVVKVEMTASDGEIQPMMWYAPKESGKKPLLVGLHTWSSNYASAAADAFYADWCIKQGWVFVHPHFRGPNMTPQAMGSDRAVQDIVEAVEWAKQQADIDVDRIYLAGVSGGGHMALLMVGRHPEIWAGVTAWCGISDIAQWHEEHMKNGVPDHYAKHIEAALGGAPVSDTVLIDEAFKRSPLAWLKQAAIVPLDINHGIHDGRTGSVPFTHSLNAFNAVIQSGTDYLNEADIASYYRTQTLPERWSKAEADAVYATWTPLFRRTAANTRITIFEGGHEMVHQAALNWLALQRRGQSAVWKVTDYIKLDVGGAESSK